LLLNGKSGPEEMRLQLMFEGW